MSTEAILGYALATIATSMGTLVLNSIRRWIGKKIKKIDSDIIDEEVQECLLEGMAKAQEEIVRSAKAANEDGKLTTEEIKKAKDLAIEHARQVAKGAAKEMLMNYTEEKLSSMIKLLLNELKRG